MVKTDLGDVQRQLSLPFFVRQRTGNDEEIKVGIRSGSAAGTTAKKDDGNQVFAKHVVGFT